MIHLFLNGLAANAGAGLTFLYNVVPQLSSLPQVRTTLAVQPELRGRFVNSESLRILDIPAPKTGLRRFWFEQAELPALISASGADVLISAGNFALRSSPVPQILLSGNSLYTSKDFYRDLIRRREYRMWLDTKIRGIFAKESLRWADCTVAPSRAFAVKHQRWSGQQVVAVHHRFDA